MLEADAAVPQAVDRELLKGVASHLIPAFRGWDRQNALKNIVCEAAAATEEIRQRNSVGPPILYLAGPGKGRCYGGAIGAAAYKEVQAESGAFPKLPPTA